MRVKLKPIDEGACDDIAEPFMKPRYDEDKDISRHAAVGKENCHNMERRYGWKLLDIEELPITAQSIFEVDCVFKGKTEFPRSLPETDADWED